MKNQKQQFAIDLLFVIKNKITEEEERVENARKLLLSNRCSCKSDNAMQEMRQYRAVADINNAEKALWLLARRRDAIVQGAIFRCFECGRKIPYERLINVPETMHCVSCAKKLKNKPS